MKNELIDFNQREEKEKIFFLPGELVTIKHDVPMKPIMIVKGKDSKLVKEDVNKDYFRGIRCFWFSTDLTLQEATFNTKDLVKVNC